MYANHRTGIFSSRLQLRIKRYERDVEKTSLPARVAKTVRKGSHLNESRQTSI